MLTALNLSANPTSDWVCRVREPWPFIRRDSSQARMLWLAMADPTARCVCCEYHSTESSAPWSDAGNQSPVLKQRYLLWEKSVSCPSFQSDREERRVKDAIQTPSILTAPKPALEPQSNPCPWTAPSTGEGRRTRVKVFLPSSTSGSQPF